MKKKLPDNIYTICSSIVTGVFMLCSIVLLTAGIMEYKNIAVSNLETYELRTSLSYVATKVRMSETENSVEIRYIDKKPVLSITEDIDGTKYETAIYYFGGNLCEYFHEREDEFSLEDGLNVLSMGDFGFEMEKNGLLKLSAKNSGGKEETMYVCINSKIR